MSSHLDVAYRYAGQVNSYEFTCPVIGVDGQQTPRREQVHAVRRGTFLNGEPAWCVEWDRQLWHFETQRWQGDPTPMTNSHDHLEGFLTELPEAIEVAQHMSIQHVVSPDGKTKTQPPELVKDTEDDDDYSQTASARSFPCRNGHRSVHCDGQRTASSAH